MQLINVVQFCSREEVLEGKLDARSLPRVADEALALEAVEFRAAGRLMLRGEDARYAGRPTVDVRVAGTVRVPCLRCLGPLDVAVDLDARYVFFDNDAQADAAAMQDETLNAAVVDQAFDIDALIEDEILLLIEEFSRHVVCPPEALAALGLVQVGEVAVRREETENPFVSLAALKKH